MKITLFTLVAALTGSVVGNLIPLTGSYLIEERQSYGGYGNACQRLFNQYPALTGYLNTTPYTAEQGRKCGLTVFRQHKRVTGKLYADINPIVFWSKSCVLAPSCVFTPRKALDVAGALRLSLLPTWNLRSVAEGTCLILAPTVSTAVY